MNDCCKAKKPKSGQGIWSGIVNGLVPHIGCIAFIVLAAVGATTAASFFKPLLLSSYFFYGLVALSLVFATISAVFYLRKREALSLEGIKNSKKYLTILYGTTIMVNLLFFFIIFPFAANIGSAAVTGAAVYSSSKITLQVNIPCPGHAPLITGELNKLDGVLSAKFSFPNYFEVTYDPNKVSKAQILSIDIFKSFKAKAV